MVRAHVKQFSVACHEVDFTYPGRGNPQLFSGFNLSLETGSWWCLVGASGGGKTTLVRLIMGLEVPDRGTVHVLGEKAPYPNVRRRIGYMPQDTAAYLDLTGRENLEFFGALSGVAQAQVKRRSDELLALLGLTAAANQLAGTYSGGMLRRLSLAVALIGDPEVLILDEPTVGLDPRQRLRIWEHLRELNQTGKTILVTTHVMDEARKCDRVAILSEGRLLATGSPADILNQTDSKTLEDATLKLLDAAAEGELR